MPPRTHRRNLVAATVVALLFGVGLAAVAWSQNQNGSVFLPGASNGPLGDNAQPTHPGGTHEPPSSEPPPTHDHGATATAAPHPTVGPPHDDCFASPVTPYQIEGVVMSLDRGPCFGACPEYMVEVHGDGTVVYEGRRWVAVEGRQEAHIERAQVEELLDAFYAARFFGLEPAYREDRHACVSPSGEVTDCDNMVTDLPTQTVTFTETVQGFGKVVVDYWNAPAALRDLEAKIDEIAGTDLWVHGPTPSPTP